jgi:diguanylate cyclase (GGDEF)-like protein
VPNNAIVGRIGGEEFAIFLPNTSPADALRLAEALRAETWNMAGLPDGLTVTASFGVSSVLSSDGLAEAFRQADMALYTAKNAGRNRVRIAEGDEACI